MGKGNKTIIKKKSKQAVKKASSKLCRPVCITEDKPLGGWMTESKAIVIKDNHALSNPSHEVDIEKS